MHDEPDPSLGLGGCRPSEEVLGATSGCSLSGPAWGRPGSWSGAKVIFHTSGYFHSGTAAAPETLL